MKKCFKKIIKPIDETNILTKVEPYFNRETSEISLGEKLKPESRKRIILNARGNKYEVFIRQFEKYPQTRLGKLKVLIDSNKIKDMELKLELCDDFDLKTNEFFYDHSPIIFEAILNFYSTNRFHYPTNICVKMFDEELKYCGFDECLIDDCCQSRYFAQKDEFSAELDAKRKILAQLYHKEDFGCIFPNVREKIWNVLDKPLDSYIGFVRK
jgi:potassium channel subfamily V protein 2